MRQSPALIRGAGAVLCLALSLPAKALDTSFSGFVSLVGGKILAAERSQPYFAFECPCHIGDYHNAGMYEGKRFSLAPESRLGLQGELKFNDRLAVAAQVVTRAVDPGLELPWAYLNYEFAPEWSLQIGRKRLPIYYYSEFQDVGFAYLWVRPPQPLYGWEASSYDGVNLRYRGMWADWGVAASLYGGRERAEDVRFTLVYNDAAQDVEWRHILGGNIEISRGVLTTRLTYLQSDNRGTIGGVWGDWIRQRVYGLALNLDFGDWFLLSEFNVNDRDSGVVDVTAAAFSVGAGLRLGRFTPYLNFSQYRDHNRIEPDYEERYRFTSVGLRYDVDAHSDLKIQFDRYFDQSGVDYPDAGGFLGDSELISVSYDRVF